MINAIDPFCGLRSGPRASVNQESRQCLADRMAELQFDVHVDGGTVELEKDPVIAAVLDVDSREAKTTLTGGLAAKIEDGFWKPGLSVGRRACAVDGVGAKIEMLIGRVDRYG